MAANDVFPGRNLGAGEEWGRTVEDNEVDLYQKFVALAQEVEGMNRGFASSLSDIAKQVQSLPQTRVGFGRAGGFGLNSGTVYVQFGITVPPNKNTVTMSIQGNVQVLDKTSGGLAVARAYIEVNGLGVTWTTDIASASKDAGASVVNNIIAVSTGFKAAVVPGNTLLVAMPITATNIFAYTPDALNYATLVATAFFTSE